MLNSELMTNSALFPEGFSRDFDAHIYYTTVTRTRAEEFRKRIQKEFAGLPVFIGRMIDYPVGPHPLPMFEIDFPRSVAERIVNWLRKERGDLTILVHEVTGDDPRDHSVGATWLGGPLQLDFSKLDPSPHS